MNDWGGQWLWVVEKSYCTLKSIEIAGQCRWFSNFRRHLSRQPIPLYQRRSLTTQSAERAVWHESMRKKKKTASFRLVVGIAAASSFFPTLVSCDERRIKFHAQPQQQPQQIRIDLDYCWFVSSLLFFFFLKRNKDNRKHGQVVP